MTREERLVAQVAKGAVRQHALKQQLAQTKRQRRTAEQRKEAQAHRQRCLFVGRLFAQAGLLALEDTDLLALVDALAALKGVPNPAAVLEACLGDIGTAVGAGAAR